MAYDECLAERLNEYFGSRPDVETKKNLVVFATWFRATCVAAL